MKLIINNGVWFYWVSQRSYGYRLFVSRGYDGVKDDIDYTFDTEAEALAMAVRYCTY